MMSGLPWDGNAFPLTEKTQWISTTPDGCMLIEDAGQMIVISRVESLASVRKEWAR